MANTDRRRRTGRRGVVVPDQPCYQRLASRLRPACPAVIRDAVLVVHNLVTYGPPPRLGSPRALLAIGALAWWSYERPYESTGVRVHLANRRSAIVAAVAALALIVVGFLPWFGVTWKVGQTGTAQTHASGWASSSHWSLGLIFIAVALGVFAAFAWPSSHSSS
jgi:hypothetical protein